MKIKNERRVKRERWNEREDETRKKDCPTFKGMLV